LEVLVKHLADSVLRIVSVQLALQLLQKCTDIAKHGARGVLVDLVESGGACVEGDLVCFDLANACLRKEEVIGKLAELLWSIAHSIDKCREQPRDGGDVVDAK
jgi:hypothetical protein